MTILLLFAPRVAGAHEIPASVAVRMFVKQDPSTLRVLVRVPLEAIRDIDFPLRPGTAYLDRIRSDSLLRQAVETWLLASIHVYEGDRDVPGVLRAARLSLASDRGFEGYGRALSHLAAPPLDPRLDVTVQGAMLDAEIVYMVANHESVRIVPALARLGVRTTSVVTFINPHGGERMLQYTGDPGAVRINPRWFHAAGQFIALGFEHILDGIDHLLFVLCLVLPFRKLKPLIGIVTAFTVAHSITLVAASLGWAPDALWFPPLVEVLIAGSIAWMAVENIVFASRNQVGRLERRWLMAFGFGLVHGFGFAFSLGESLQFAGAHLALALMSFNVGVEIGQVLVLLAAVPVLGLLYSRVVPERVGIILISAFITHTAWHWLGERWSALGRYQIEWSLAGMLPLIRVVMAIAIGVGLAAIVGRAVRFRQKPVQG